MLTGKELINRFSQVFRNGFNKVINSRFIRNNRFIRIVTSYSRNPERIANTRILVEILLKEFTNQSNDLELKTSLDVPGLKKESESSEESLIFSKLEIDSSIISVLCGTLLGDGSIKRQKGYKNLRIQYRHSTRQTDWFMWKTLGPLSRFFNNSQIQFQAPDGFQAKTRPIGGECLGKLSAVSSVSSTLNNIFAIICKDNDINIKREWLNEMNAYFLMALWLDDGSLSNRREGYICLYSTPKEQLEILAEYIKTVWGVDCKVDLFKKQVPPKKDQYRISIANQENLYKLMKIIAPLVPVKCMLYKVCFYPSGNKELLERWSTEMKQLIRPEWHDEINKQNAYYGIKLTKTSKIDFEEDSFEKEFLENEFLSRESFSSEEEEDYQI
jgi:hypothetical protein